MARTTKPKPPSQQNIPAFQRKRSLSAKARKKRKPATALERKEAGVPVIKPPRRRRTTTRRSTVTSSSSASSSSSTSSMSDVYERRERLKARLAARDGASHGSVGGGFSSLSRVEEQISGGGGGFSAPMLEPDDGYEPVVYGSASSPESGVREMRACGVVELFFDKIDVVAIKLNGSIRVGDKLVYETQDGLFEQEVESIQIDREEVMTAYTGDDVGIRVQMAPKKGGNVYKVI